MSAITDWIKAELARKKAEKLSTAPMATPTGATPVKTSNPTLDWIRQELARKKGAVQPGIRPGIIDPTTVNSSPYVQQNQPAPQQIPAGFRPGIIDPTTVQNSPYVKPNPATRPSLIPLSTIPTNPWQKQTPGDNESSYNQLGQYYGANPTANKLGQQQQPQYFRDKLTNYYYK